MSERRYLTMRSSWDVGPAADAALDLALSQDETWSIRSNGYASPTVPGTTNVAEWVHNAANFLNIAGGEISRANNATPHPYGPGWVTETLEGYTFDGGSVTLNLPIYPYGGVNKDGRLFCRLSVVRINELDQWTYDNLTVLSTSIPGEESHDAGQEGWCGASGTTLAPTGSISYHSADFNALNSFTFTADQRLLLEIGWGNVAAAPAGYLQWRIYLDTSATWIDLPLYGPTQIATIIGDPAYTERSRLFEDDALEEADSISKFSLDDLDEPAIWWPANDIQVEPGSNDVSFLMRAKQISTGNFVYWTTFNAPDPTGVSSGVSVDDLMDVVCRIRHR